MNRLLLFVLVGGAVATGCAKATWMPAETSDHVADLTRDPLDLGKPPISPRTSGDLAQAPLPDDLASPGLLVLSQIRTRGLSGASDEFVELYNAGSSPITLDTGWTLVARSSNAATFGTRWTSANQVVPAEGHLLLAGSGYNQAHAADAQLGSITDASALHLLHNGVIVDRVCYAYDASTRSKLADPSYNCAGSPADNTPHNDGTSAASNSDAALERKTASGDDATDFGAIVPAKPRSLTSP